MRWVKGCAVALMLAVAFAAGADARPGAKAPKPGKVTIRNKGQAFCPSSIMVVGTVAVRAGRCYLIAVMRDRYGTFLAFLPPDATIPRGEVVRLNTRPGARLKRRTSYLVQIHPQVAILQMDSMALVGVMLKDMGPQLSLTIIGMPAPGLTVIFNLRA